MESSGDDKKRDSQSTESPRFSNAEASRRYAALRNHSIRFEEAIDPNAERVNKLEKMDIGEKYFGTFDI